VVEHDLQSGLERGRTDQSGERNERDRAAPSERDEGQRAEQQRDNARVAGHG
jgi:hypothetical protein